MPGWGRRTYGFLEAFGLCASVLHQKQGNKSIRAIHEIQETRVVTTETAIRRKENLRIPARQLSQVPAIGTEGIQGKKNPEILYYLLH